MVDVISRRYDTALVEPAEFRLGSSLTDPMPNKHKVYRLLGMSLAAIDLTCHSTPRQSCLLCGHLHIQTLQCSLQCNASILSVLSAAVIMSDAAAAAVGDLPVAEHEEKRLKRLLLHARDCVSATSTPKPRRQPCQLCCQLCCSGATTNCAPCFIMTCKNLITTLEEGLIST